jgi:hypothetical protein
MHLIGKSALVVGVLMMAVTIVSFGNQTQKIASPRSIIYDTHFVEAMNNLSRVVPENAVLVVSTNSPFVTYFTGHITKVPFGASSEEDLINYMRSWGYQFLVVFEGKSDVPGLKTLFSSGGAKGLEVAFARLAEYRTDFNVILVYKLKSL